MKLGGIGTVSYDIIAQDKTEAGTKSASNRVAEIGKIAGAAATAIGVGMMAITDSTKKTNASLGTTALQLGITTEEMRELALETTNVTFPIEEVTASFDLLTRAGMTNTEQMKETATAFDTLGDAIGLSASEVTSTLIPAFNAYNIPLEEAGNYTDLFTHLTRNTTVELSDFSGMLNYLAADLGTMEISMQDSVAVMEILADRGIQGSAATREFRTAVSQAEGDTDAFYEALGITSRQMGEYNSKIDESKGMTDEFAAAQNEQYTTMDRLKQKISEATLEFGSMLEPIEALGPVFTTLGPAMMTFTAIQQAGVIPALSAHAVAAWAAISPYLAIIAPIAAVVGIFVLLEKRFGLVTTAIGIATEAFEFLKTGFISLLDFLINFNIEFYKAGVGLILSFAKGIREKIGEAINTVRDAVQTMRDYLPGSDAKTGPLSDITASGKGMMTTLAKGVREGSPEMQRTINNTLNITTGPITNAGDEIDLANRIMSSLSGTQSGVV